MKIAVIGAGILGITSALKLQESGVDVTIYSKDDPLETNSDAAVATWFAPDNSRLELQKLCLLSLGKFIQLSQDLESGVSLIPMRYLFKDEEEYQQSAFAKEACIELLGIKPHDPVSSERSSEYPFSVTANTPLIDVNFYRPYLLKMFAQNGGKVLQQEVGSFSDLSDAFDVVVNCSGWEARKLTGDVDVLPARGQIEIISKGDNFSLAESTNIQDLGMYVVFRPLSRDIVVGATHDPYSFECRPRDADRAKLLETMKDYIPETKDSEIESQVGVRACRNIVRLEAERIITSSGRQLTVVHNYGHGGCGYSASWSAANRTLNLCLSRSNQKDTPLCKL